MSTKWSGPKLPPGVSASPKVKADGSVTWYFYHKPTKTRLLQEPGTPAFERELQRALGAASVEPAVARETLADICDKFEKSGDHLDCAASTRLHRETVLKTVRARWGEYESVHLSNRKFRGEILEWRDEMRGKPGMADHSIQILQRLMAWAYDRGMIEYNHATKIKPKSKSKPRKGKGITPAQHEALMATGEPDEIRLYLFARYTGLRRADLCLISWSNLDADGWIEWKHSKTQHSTEAISFYPTFALPPLEKLIDELPRRSGTDAMLTTHTGQRWSGENINKRWQAWKIRAGIKNDDVHFHDLRRQLINDLLKASCTNGEGGSISGHVIAGRNEGSFDDYADACREMALNAYHKLAAYLDRAGPSNDKKIVPLKRA